MNEAIEARYFDGRSSRPQPVRVALYADVLLVTPIAAEPPGDEGEACAREGKLAAPLRWPLAQVQWPERTRYGRRVVHLADGGQLDFPDAARFDGWRAASARGTRRAAGLGESWVVRAQQNWRATCTALVLLAAVVAAGYRWGVPWAADAVVAVVPEHVDRAIGEAAFENLRSKLLAPSKLPAARQQALREACHAALGAAVPLAMQRPWQLHFHDGGRFLGPNAFALPDGSIVITDQMVALLEGHDDTLIGIFGHEYGHLRERHGMRSLARFALVSTAASVALGDFSSVLAGLPALLAQMGYSRDAEREADHHAAQLLVANGRDPAAMVVLFDRLAADARGGKASEADGERRRSQDGGLPIAFASHPRDEERVRFFREYGRRR